MSPIQWMAVDGMLALIVGLALLRPGASRARRGVGAAFCPVLPVGVGLLALDASPSFPATWVFAQRDIGCPRPAASHATTDLARLARIVVRMDSDGWMSTVGP